MELLNKFVRIDDKRIHYIESTIDEQKDTLLFLHGKSFKADTWSSIGTPERVNEMGLNYVAVDYPGWGESEKNDVFYPPTRKYSNAAVFLEKFTESIGLKRFSLLGASFSGPFAISYVSKHPESIDKLILIGPVWSEELSQEASTIKKPVLVMYGENDSVIPIDSFLKYNNTIRGSSLLPVRKAGHALYLDNREEFFKSLETFLHA